MLVRSIEVKSSGVQLEVSAAPRLAKLATAPIVLHVWRGGCHDGRHGGRDRGGPPVVGGHLASRGIMGTFEARGRDIQG